jgi:hypothetical protein
VSDIKLFRIGGAAEEMLPQSPQVEKSLQAVFERNLETLLGIRFWRPNSARVRFTAVVSIHWASTKTAHR